MNKRLLVRVVASDKVCIAHTCTLPPVMRVPYMSTVPKVGVEKGRIKIGPYGVTRMGNICYSSYLDLALCRWILGGEHHRCAIVWLGKLEIDPMAIDCIDRPHRGKWEGP